MIKKIICCLIATTFLNQSAFAEYYLVYSGSPCEYCYKTHFKKIKYKKVTHHKIKKKKHYYCAQPQRVSHTPVHRYHHWVPGYWENGFWIPPHQIKSASRRHSHYKIYYDEDYNLDLTTGDDNPYVHPGMNIDN